MKKAQIHLVLAVAILVLASFLRFHQLEAQSFWNDEGNSARLSERSVAAILEGTASDIHPPLYYLILRGWRELVGDTEFGLRSLSTFAGILTVATTIMLGRAMGGRRPVAATLMAGLLAAASPVLVYYSQEARMYALLALVGALSTWVLWVWGGRYGSIWPVNRWAIAYVLLTALGLYTHYFYPAVIVAHGLIVLFLTWRQKQQPSRTSGVSGSANRVSRFWKMPASWTGMVVIASVLYLPWFPIFLRQVGGRAGNSLDLAAFAGETAQWLALGPTIAVDDSTVAVLSGLALIVLGTIAAKVRAVPLFILVGVPWIIMALTGATDPAYFKFLLVVVPFLCVLAGFAWRLRGWGRIAPLILSIFVLVGSVNALRNLYTDASFARADYRGIAQRIATEAHPNAGIILNAPNQWEAFTYYHRQGAPVYPLPRSQPEPSIVEPELKTITAAHDRLYVLFWGEGQRDPERVVERWLDANAYKASEEWVGDVRFVIYAVPQALSIDDPQSMTVLFVSPDNEEIRLHELAFGPAKAVPGDIILFRFLWEGETGLTRRYKVFIHLIDSQGRLVAQRDSEPGGGLRPTTSWQPGEVVVDQHGLLIPNDLPPGEYLIRLGLYDLADPSARLLHTSGDQPADSLDVGFVIIN